MKPLPASAEAIRVDDSDCDVFASPDWALAFDFSERLASLRRRGGISEFPVDQELAGSRLERWRQRAGLDKDDTLWQRRLVADGVTQQEILTLLGEPTEAIQERLGHSAEWLDELRRAYRAENAEPFPWPPSTAKARERSPFLPLAEPLIRSARDRLAAGITRLVERFPEAPFEPHSAADAFLGHLPGLLTPHLGRPLVVELHAARLEERLIGETPEERFSNFRQSLYHRSVALEILAAYPVLARRLVVALEQWVQAAHEVLERIAAHTDEIRRRFASDSALDRLVAARGGISDPHRGGRGVFLLRFASGLRLVYKPRPLAVEAAFQKLLGWLNDEGFTPPFRTLEVLDCGSWGLMEYVDVAPAADRPALVRFFRRQGAFAALFQLLDGTDFHHENVIAAGEHPVPVDLETLFHPWVAGETLDEIDEQPGAILAESPLRGGLLPHRLWGNQEQAGVDISGLGAKDGQLTPQAMLTLSQRNTDAMHFERRQVEIPIAENRPSLEGGEVSFLDHTEDLEEGFMRLRRFIGRRQQVWLAADGPLAAFAHIETRVLLRPTAGYGQVLHESGHPHALTNALECQFFFDRLWAEVATRPYLASLIPSELRDFARGDIPAFWTRPNSRHLWTSDDRCLTDFFGTSALERVRRRIASLGEKDLTRQLSAVRAAFDVARLSDRPAERPSYVLRERSEPATSEELVAAARGIGDHLVAAAFENSVDALWLFVDHGEPDGWRVGVCGPDFYHGLPGIALFLGQLGALTGEAKYTTTARRALASQQHQLAENPQSVTGIGAWNGWGGLIYAATHLGVLWNDPAQLDAAEGYLERVAPRVEDDSLLDVIAGSAGLILSLLVLARDRPSRLLGRTLRAAGERLLEMAEPQPRGGLGWVMPLAGNRPLAGFSHGAAGIALALLRLSAATGDPRYRQAALGGMAYERSLFDPEERSWPDLRAEPETAGLDGVVDRFLCAWCHGAPGVGLARLAGLDVYDEAQVREEIAIAIATTLEKGFGRNHCLCHGDLGNLDFLLEAAIRLEDQELRARVGRLAGGILEAIQTHGHLYGLPGNTETPGLMVGLAGIGHGLLRLADPEQIPCLLALDPPGSDHASRTAHPPLAENVLESWVGDRGRSTPPTQTKETSDEEESSRQGVAQC